MDPRTLNLESLSLTDIIRLQNQLSKILTLRFERQAAVVFSDIVDSTQYFSKFGDEAGRRMQQQHFDLTAECLTGSDGKILDSAGDESRGRLDTGVRDRRVCPWWRRCSRH